MIDLYFWPTPNGHKISIFLEEVGAAYEVVPVNIGRGEQFSSAFLAISPNNKMPAIVDRTPKDGGAPISVFESGAILEYLAEKTGQLMPQDLRGKTAVREWLAWQVGGVGPMCGQLGHFDRYATEKIPYAIERYSNEVHRLYGVLDKRLEGRDFVAGDYSIADIASFPWLREHARNGVDLAEFPRVRAWLDRISARPGVARGLRVGEDLGAGQSPMDDEARKHLFGQRARD